MNKNITKEDLFRLIIKRFIHQRITLNIRIAFLSLHAAQNQIVSVLLHSAIDLPEN